MLFPTTISLILALAPVTLFAAPTRTVESTTIPLTPRHLSADVIRKLEDGACNLSGASMPTGQ